MIPILLLALTTGLQFDANVSEKLKAQVLSDFQFLQSIQGSKASPVHAETFGSVNGSNYQNWFSSRVFYFGLDGCGGNSAVACVKPQFKNKVWVTSNYTAFDHPQISRLMTLFHEARHTEDAHENWPHAKCPRVFPHRSIWTGGRLANHTACDATAYGSYASASVMLNNVARFCENCSEKVKADAKIYADDQVLRVIEPAAIALLKKDFVD